jgi:hypothetical protein
VAVAEGPGASGTRIADRERRMAGIGYGERRFRFFHIDIFVSDRKACAHRPLLMGEVSKFAEGYRPNGL